MTKYFFILGSNPDLSIVELNSVLGKANITTQTREFVIADLETNCDITKLQNRLGGVIKIGQIINNSDHNNISEDILNILNQEQKSIFGISFYNNQNKFRLDIKKIGISIKKNLRDQGERARFVISRETNLSSVAVVKNRLLDKGVEIVILNDQNRFIIGLTLTVQDFENYNFRDYGRPRPAPRSGMLPPKVAQMMINISQANIKDVILDPFCGSGTVLQELANLGFENIIGSDLDAPTVVDCQTNIDWFLKTILKKSLAIKIMPSDAKQISKKIDKTSIDKIITEPYLGLPLTGFENFQILQHNRNNLENLYTICFSEFHKILKPHGTIVIIFPRWQKNGQILSIDILDKVKKIGFNIKPLSATPRGSVIYQKDTQHLSREIFVFQKI